MKKNIDIQEIIKLKKQGKSIKEISEILNCSRINIYRRLKKVVNQDVNQDVNHVNQNVNQDVNHVNQDVNHVNQNQDIVNQIVNQVIILLRPIIVEIVNQNVNQDVNQNQDFHILYNKILYILSEELNKTSSFKDKEKKEKKINKRKEKREIEVKTPNEIIKVEIPQKVKEPQPAIQLIFDFASLIGIEKVDTGFIKKNIKYAYQLLKEHEYNEILGLVNWVNNNSEFWAGKVKNLGIVYGHFSEWILDFQKTKENKYMTVGQWLAKHPEYKPTQPKGTLERYRELLRVFNLALKDKNVIPTQEEWNKYKFFREQIFKELKEV